MKAAASARRLARRSRSAARYFTLCDSAIISTPLNPAVNSYLAQVQPGYLQQTGDPAAAQQMAWQSLENLREHQASALAYFDAFLIFAVVGVVLAFLVLLMKRSVVEKGAHIAAE